MADGQSDNSFAPTVEERVGGDEQCFGSRLDQCREGRVEVVLRARFQDDNLSRERGSSRLRSASWLSAPESAGLPTRLSSPTLAPLRALAPAASPPANWPR